MAKKAKTSESINSDPVASRAETKWASLGWLLLFVGGMAHMLIQQMGPVLNWGLFGVKLEFVLGVVSVFIAMYFLLGSEE